MPVNDDGFVVNWPLIRIETVSEYLVCDECKKECEEVYMFNTAYYPYKQLLNRDQELCKCCFDSLDKKLNKKILAHEVVKKGD